MMSLLGWVILIVILVVIYYSKPAIDGFWVADDDFCEDAGCDSLMVYIGEKTKGYRTCMLVITDDIVSQVFKLKEGIDTSCSPWKTKKRCTIEFDGDQFWPKNVIITTDLNTNTMVITDNSGGNKKEILAIVRKD